MSVNVNDLFAEFWTDSMLIRGIKQSGLCSVGDRESNINMSAFKFMGNRTNLTLLFGASNPKNKMVRERQMIYTNTVLVKISCQFIILPLD